MDADFTLSVVNGNSVLNASPKLATEIGAYTFEIIVCLTNYNTQCSVTLQSQFSITACIVTSFTMITLSPTYDQSYTVL